MSSAEPQRAPQTAPAQASDVVQGTGEVRPFWVVSLIAGVLAGLGAWAGGEWVETSYRAPIVSEFVVAGNVQLARRAALITTKATLAYGLLGAILGLLSGLAGGLTRRSPRGAAIAGIVGLVLGGVAGAVAARSFV